MLRPQKAPCPDSNVPWSWIAGKKRFLRAGWFLLGAAALVSCGGVGDSTDATEASVATAKSMAPSSLAAAVADKPRTVTLLTGDKVTVRHDGGRRVVQVQPAKGRERVVFSVSDIGKDLVVMPSSEAALVASGKLDAELFNVSKLLEYRYDDDSRADLPLIVVYNDVVASASLRGKLKAQGQTGVKLVHELRSVRGWAVSQSKAAASGFLAPLTEGTALATFSGKQAGGIKKIWLDGLLKPVLSDTVPQIGAPVAWQAGLTGEGVTVAVLDTGIDNTHPDLATQVIDAANFTPEETTEDMNGHGTFVASVLAGTGAASDGRLRGVAPGARLVSGKVCTQAGTCTHSDVIAGMEWAVLEKHVKVVNLSLGHTDTPEVDPMEETLNRLSAEHGTLFVVAAGNNGGEGTVTSPSSADAALSVSAVDKSDEWNPISSQGPRVGDGAIKPDITAPGRFVTAARAKDAIFGTPGNSYFMASGTSVAAPHVAAAAAILLQQHPDWQADQLKATLMASSTAHPELTVFQQGAGRVNVAQAIAQTVTTSPPSVSLGKIRPGADGDVRAKQTLVYRNTGSVPVTLDLRADVRTPDDEPAPDGLFTVIPASVQVPAGGTASVTVIADLHGQTEGMYKGRIVAHGAAVSIATPVAVELEIKRFTVTFKHLGPSGGPADTVITELYHFGDLERSLMFGDGSVSLRPGKYLLQSIIQTQAEDGQYSHAFLVNPALDITGDTTVTLDARSAKPIELSVPDPAAKLAGFVIGYVDVPLSKDESFSLIAGSIEGLSTAHLGPVQPASDFIVWSNAFWAHANAQGRFNNSPQVYVAGWRPDGGSYPTGMRHVIGADQLATVRQRNAAAVSKKNYARIIHGFDVPGLDRGHIVAFQILYDQAPFQRIEHYHGDGLGWRGDWLQFDPADLSVDEATLQTLTGVVYEAGKSYVDVWNGGPLAPAFVPGQVSMARQGDQLVLAPALFSDQAGHAGLTSTQLLQTYSARLYQDGQKVFESSNPAESVVSVPSAAATYRFETSATRGVSDLSTRVEAAWTFKSGPVADGTPVPLPVSVVRFTPRLDDHNRAAGGHFVLPVSVQRQAGAAEMAVKSLQVQVSYDQGVTWQVAPLRHLGDRQWVARLQHPAHAAFVSLRATAVDGNDNAVTQTVIRAYGLRHCTGPRQEAHCP